MSRRRAKRLIRVGSRLFLALALVFSSGAWAQALSAALDSGCPHDQIEAAAHSGHGQAGGGSGRDCCNDSDALDCRDGSVSCAACAAACASGWHSGLIGSAPSSRLPPSTAAPDSRGSRLVPAPAIYPALRPPIFA